MTKYRNKWYRFVSTQLFSLTYGNGFYTISLNVFCVPQTTVTAKKVEPAKKVVKKEEEKEGF